MRRGLQRGPDAWAPPLQATLIEYNLDLVNGALLAVNSALAQGMDWQQLAQLIKSERKAGNPVRPPPSSHPA